MSIMKKYQIVGILLILLAIAFLSWWWLSCHRSLEKTCLVEYPEVSQHNRHQFPEVPLEIRKLWPSPNAVISLTCFEQGEPELGGRVGIVVDSARKDDPPALWLNRMEIERSEKGFVGPMLLNPEGTPIPSPYDIVLWNPELGIGIHTAKVAIPLTEGGTVIFEWRFRIVP